MFALLPLLAVLAMAPPPTQTVSTPRFKIVHTEGSKGAAQKLAGEIEPVRDRLQKVLGRDWDGITEIRVGAGREEMEALALPGGFPPSWAVALAYPEANIVLLDANSLNQPDGPATLRHELVHVALGRLGHHWPRWFHEGLAQQITGERIFAISTYQTLARAVATGRIFDFDDLTRGFPERPSDVEIAYAQSASFVDFLASRHGATEFAAILDGVQAGETFELAFAKACKSSLSLEEMEWKKGLKSRFPWWPLLVFGDSIWAVLGALVAFGFWRRRRQLKAWHQQQELIEAAEAAAERIALAEEARALAEAAAAAQQPPEPGTPPAPPFLH